MARTDVSLQSLSLAKAKDLLLQGWVFNFHRGDKDLEVWISRKDEPAVYEVCNPRDFVELAKFYREIQQQERKANPPIVHALVLKSKNVYSYGYSESSKVLEVRFKDRKTQRKAALYRYFDVDPETVEAFENWRSKGQAVQLLLTPNFRYEKVDETTVAL